MKRSCAKKKREREREEKRRGEAGACPPGDLNTKSPSLVQFPLVCFFPFSSFRIPSRVPTTFPRLPACVPRVFLGVTRFLCAARPDHRRKNDFARKRIRAVLLNRCFFFFLPRFLSSPPSVSCARLSSSTSFCFV